MRELDRRLFAVMIQGNGDVEESIEGDLLYLILLNG